MSKRSESIKALRQMNDEELVVHLRQQRRKLFEVRFQQATGQVENHRLIRDLRREIGRTMTVQIEFARAILVAEPVGDARGREPVGASVSERRREGARARQALPAEPVRRHPSSAPDASDAAGAKPPGKAAAVEDAKPAKRVRRSRAKVADEPVAAETAGDDEPEEGKTDA
jgi:large subunit ribosomal protein L29